MTTDAQDRARARIADIADVPLPYWEANPGELADALDAVADGLGDDGKGTPVGDAEDRQEAGRLRMEAMAAEVRAKQAAKNAEDARKAYEDKVRGK